MTFKHSKHEGRTRRGGIRQCLKMMVVALSWLSVTCYRVFVLQWPELVHSVLLLMKVKGVDVLTGFSKCACALSKVPAWLTRESFTAFHSCFATLWCHCQRHSEEWCSSFFGYKTPTFEWAITYKSDHSSWGGIIYSNHVMNYLTVILLFKNILQKVLETDQIRSWQRWATVHKKMMDGTVPQIQFRHWKLQRCFLTYKKIE